MKIIRRYTAKNVTFKDSRQKSSVVFEWGATVAFPPRLKAPVIRDRHRVRTMIKKKNPDMMLIILIYYSVNS